MARRHFNLPPLSALDAFEAAARHGSFKRASRELNVSPSAVSHQIRALEADLDVELFERHRRGVVLNQSGSTLYTALQHGFRHMGEAVEQLRRQARDRGVQVVATTAMSYLWLTPALAQFWREHGNITVNQQVTDAPWQDEPCDLLIRYGDMAEDTGDCQMLFEDRLVPLVSPEFAERHSVETVTELARLPLIRLNAPDLQWTSWRDWLAEMGHEGDIHETISVNNYVIALQAAQDSVGVVLGWERMTRPLIRRGLLVPISGFSSPAPNVFYVRKSTGASPQADLLRDWLVKAAQQPSLNRT